MTALPHFLSLPRGVYGRLTQCRTGHAFVGEYYDKFVPSEDTSCPCGERLQTRAHVLRDCPRYVEHRHILRDAVPDLGLADIFGTKEGIGALGKFLASTDAFQKAMPSAETDD